MLKTVLTFGIEELPPHLKGQSHFATKLVDDPYSLKNIIQNTEGECLVLSYLQYLDVRYLNLINQIYLSHPKTKVVFIVEELSEQMRLLLQDHPDFLLLWRPEESHLVENLLLIFKGTTIESRQERRSSLPQSSQLGPPQSALPIKSDTSFPSQISQLINISKFGGCLRLNTPFLNKKDYVNITYLDNKGDYISVDGQIRWIRWNQRTMSHELGVQFLALI